MTGTGQGELLLHGGTISLNFTVNNAPPPSQSAHTDAAQQVAAAPHASSRIGSRQLLARQPQDRQAAVLDSKPEVADPPEGQHPHINVVGSGADFSSIELSIRSYAADWLYQAVLTLFNDQITKAVMTGINGALRVSAGRGQSVEHESQVVVHIPYPIGCI